MRIQTVDVNVAAFKNVSTFDELKAEEGRIFGHLPEEQQEAGYKKLWEEVIKLKPLAAVPAISATAEVTQAAPAKISEAPVAPAEVAPAGTDKSKAGDKIK